MMKKVPPSTMNPSQKLMVQKAMTLATSTALSRQAVYSRYRSEPPTRPERPTLLLKA